MSPAKVLIVYFSRTGRTKILARELSHKLGCAIEEVKTPKRYSGFFGYQFALLQATFKVLPEIAPLQSNLANYDLIIMGGPVWGGSICSPLRTFIESYKHEFKNVAFMATQSGIIGRNHVFDQMRIATQRTPLATLDIAERDFKNGLYKNSISSFIMKLSLINPKINKRRIAEPTTTEANY